MKKILTVLLAGTMIVFAAGTGCVKSSDSPTNPVSALPDLANFLLEGASTFVAGAASMVSITSSSLGAGTFNVNFDLTGANIVHGATAVLTMNGSTGTFQTPTLPNAGKTDIVINSISNASGSSYVTSNNSWSISDSTGLVTATRTSGSTTTPFRATDVQVSVTGPLLAINATVWEPDLSTITLRNLKYNSTTPVPYTIHFNTNDTTTFNGNAAYGLSSSAAVISDLSIHGTITFTTVSPLMTGSFTYTNQDSSVVTGSFSCKAP